MDASSESGSMPWLIVRLPCGSRSTHSTRWPRSTKAAARFSVVVVFATPPFWFVNAMTFALGSITQAVFARAGRNPSPFPSGGSATRQAPHPRDRQGRGREDDRRGGARARGGAARQPRRAVRGRHGARRDGARPRAVRGLGRPRAGEAGVAPLPAEVADAGRGSGRKPPVPVPDRSRARAERAG